MDRTLIAVHNMLAAIHATSYDIGVLSERGMLPGLANLSAANVISRLPLLKSHNAKGAHIYIRPSGEHRYTVLDDLNQDSVDRLAADGYGPCAVVETSPGNFQAWLKHDDVYPANLSTFVAQTLAQRYQADPSAADWRRFGRLPGFTNCKPKYRQSNGLYPYVLLKSWTVSSTAWPPTATRNDKALSTSTAGAAIPRCRAPGILPGVERRAVFPPLP